jgi:hypothetical protein
MHTELSKIGETCAVTGQSVLNEEIKKIPSPHLMRTGTVGDLRKRIKEILKQDLDRIDVLVAALFKSKSV